MEIALIDPRDITWELRDPTYRVYFWTVVDHVSSEWRITEAIDVHEVIAWAEAQRGERTYELFIEHVHRDASAAGEGADEAGLIRLAGADPTTGTRGGATVTISSDERLRFVAMDRSCRPVQHLPTAPYSPFVLHGDVV